MIAGNLLSWPKEESADIVCQIKEYDIKLMTIPGRRGYQLGANDREARRAKRSC